MYEQYFYTREMYNKWSCKLARQSSKTPFIYTTEQIMYTIFSINNLVTKLYIMPGEEDEFELVVYSNSPFDDYTLNFLRRYKNPLSAYNIRVRGKWFWFLYKTIQKVKIERK